jgi:hypothetical protein
MNGDLMDDVVTMAMPVLRWIGQRIAMVEGEMNA